MNKFDNLANRKNTYSIKWNTKDNELPMWIADQDFFCFNEIYKALEEEINIKAYGYVELKDDYFASYQNWFYKRNGFLMETDKMIFSEGVVGSISAICNYFLHGDYVTILTPVYNIFRNSVLNNHGKLLISEMYEENMDYYVDWQDFEEKISKSKIFILCNPVNPVGKIWTKDELIKIGEICAKYNVLVLSDEIHCDFIQNNQKFYHFAEVSDLNKEISVTMLSPSKTFNIAGLKSSICYVYNDNLYKKVYRAINNVELGEPGFFAIKPIIYAYNNGLEYINELNSYIYENKHLVFDFIKENLPNVKYKIQDSLFLIWLDCTYYQKADLVSYIKDNTGLILASGKIYGEKNQYFLRMNLATSKQNVIDGLNRLKMALDSIKK